MAKELKKPIESKLEQIIQEYNEKVSQTLEEENNELKRQAEKDSSNIIAKAKEEAEEIISSAREKASEDAREEAEQLINDLKENTEKIIAEVISRVSKEAKNEFAQAVSKAKDRINAKTTKLVSEVTGSVNKIVADFENTVREELAHLDDVITETETTLQNTGKNNAFIVFDELKKDVENSNVTNPRELKKSKTREKYGETIPEPSLTREVENTEEESPKGQKSETGENGNFQGDIKLDMIPPFNREHSETGRELLTAVPGLKIISTCGYAGANRWITTYNIRLEKPLPLLEILKASRSVKEATERKGNLVVTLRQVSG